ncbi:unnamed protein product [Arabidopsis halleri]
MQRWEKDVSGCSSMGQKLGFDSRGKGIEEIVSRLSPFDELPEDCVSNIISLTSPRDVCIAASVSRTLRLTVQSDSVWEKFLPTEYASLIPEWRGEFSRQRRSSIFLYAKSLF